MKLIKCYIENFGKLSNFTYDFADGWNVIMEDNGYGKTTLAVFLKAMFYGLAGTGKTSVAVNERKHYAPWQGGAFGGTVLFEENGKRYLIERFFGEKDKDETFVLYDADTNLESKDYSNRIGEELFLLDREAFEKSIYMPQQCLQTSGNDSLSAKLSNLTEQENDINHFELAKANLEKKQKELLRIGEKGKIWELRHIVSDLERKLKELDGVQENMRLWNEKRQSVEELQKKAEEKLALLKEELKHASEYEQKKTKMLHYRTLWEKLKNTKERLEQMQAFFPEEVRGRIETYTQLEEYFAAIEVKNEYTTKVSVLEVTKESLIKEKQVKEAEVDRLKRVYEKFANEPFIEQNNSSLPFVAAVALCLSGIGMFFVQKAAGILLLLAGIVAICFFINRKQRQSRLEQEVFTKHKQEQEQVLIQLNMAQKEFSDILKKLDRCEEDITSQKEILQRNKEKLEEFFRDFSAYENIKEADYMAALSEIKEKAAVCLSLQTEVLEQMKSVQQFEHEKAEIKESMATESQVVLDSELDQAIQEEKEKAVSCRALDVVQMEQNEWYKKLQSLTEEKSQIGRQLDALSMRLEMQEELSIDLEHNRLELIECERQHEILTMTIKYLEKAKDSFSTRYLTKLKESFDAYMEILNEEVLGEAAVDTKLKLKVTQGGKKKDLDYFSAGYRDLINLCMRFAMIDALYEKEKPFLILDDPFVNMDEGKLKRALAFVKRLSKEYQIIYFICHESRR